MARVTCVGLVGQAVMAVGLGMALALPAWAEDPPPDPAIAAAMSLCDKEVGTPLSGVPGVPEIYFDDLRTRFDLMGRNAAFFDPLIKACTMASTAKNAHPRFTYQLARLYYLDGLFSKDVSSLAAYAAIRTFADKGWPDAQAMLAKTVVFRGPKRMGLTPAQLSAIRIGLRSAALAGHVDAMLLYAGAIAIPKSTLAEAHDPIEAARILALLGTGAPDKRPNKSDYVASKRFEAVLLRARLVTNNPAFSEADKLSAFETFKRLAEGGDNEAKLSFATSLEKGRSTAADPVQARAIFTELAAQPNEGPTRFVAYTALASLARMMIEGRGGAADAVQARARLEKALAEKPLNATELSTILAGLLMDGAQVAREPRNAMALLEKNLYDPATLLLLARLLEESRFSTTKANDILERLVVAAKDSNGREPAMALGRLAAAGIHPFATSRDIITVLAPFAKDDLDARLLLVRVTMRNLGSSSFKLFLDPSSPYDVGSIPAVIEEGIKAGKPAALVIRALMLREGDLVPQDDRAATKALIEAAKSNDPEALTLLGKAYDEGLGVKRDQKAAAAAWRAAARQRYLPAREAIASGAIFGGSIPLREALIETIGLYSNGEGFRFDSSSLLPSSAKLAGVFSGGRMMGADVDQIADVLLDGLRYAPAGLDDERLVPLAKAQTDEVRVAIEKRLKAEGFYTGETDGFFDPPVRDAVRAYVKAKGPLLSPYE